MSFVNAGKKPRLGLGKAPEVEKRNGSTLRMWSGPMSQDCVGSGFGSFQNGVCGAGMLINIFTQALEWATIAVPC